ncbi:MAG: class I SAM-dependent methyltransferase [Armatimonadota bacterium]|nr:class I SAM-dependent methyltransferase [Armatimonadota bacterium]MDR7459654.1 class I SAM-dependent methyltransferase [Armatimonadota bacterium]MDR7480594.1 class I SAM-dependent methyltransferase [Armatimonadota bacterium]MDR7488164.1 class I SAM-dependent methyltransferase [Armatimonadota bacterium]MDR7491288.1 class I SAM-dependent methyltransferase [Armatimonadota bacterium]
MVPDVVDVVCGRRLERVPAAALRVWAQTYQRVVVDLGAGDGRAAYRLARTHPTWAALAVDPDVRALREVSWRAARPVPRGGAPNACFIRAALEMLPAGLDALADEIRIAYPWGSLLRTVLGQDAMELRRMVRLGAPGAQVRAEVNRSALAVVPGGPEAAGPDLAAAWEAAGLRVVSVVWGAPALETSWGRRLNPRGRVRVLQVEGRVLRAEGECLRRNRAAGEAVQAAVETGSGQRKA